MFTSTGEGLSVPPQGSETLWSLSFLLGTSEKELGEVQGSVTQYNDFIF